MKTIIAAFALLGSLVAAPAFAQDYTGGSVSYNYLDWTQNTEDRSHLTDFSYLEAELWGGRDWGSFYGFVDLERFDEYKELQDVKISAKATVSVNTQYQAIKKYGQIYTYAEKDFQVVDTVAGMQYTMNGSNWNFNPFVGLQYSVYNNNFNDTSFNGINGLMVGWNAMYKFEMIGQDFSVTNWNEFTMLRDEEYQKVSGEKNDIGTNGAVAIWWHPTSSLATGIQYRYADHKLGTEINSNGFIYTVKYLF